MVLQIFAIEIYTPLPLQFHRIFRIALYFNYLIISSILHPSNAPKMPFCNVEIAKLMFTKLFLYCTLTCFVIVFISFFNRLSRS